MSETHATKNYFTDNGDELVIGGKLTILDSAVVEGLGSDTHMIPAAALPDSEATTVAGLKESFNALLGVLRDAGLMSSSREPGDG